MKKRPIYLDYNATTPVDREVLEAMMPFFSENFGNASSSQHVFGWEAEEAVAQSRERVANLIGAKPSEIIFTSGATEGINLALKGLLESKTKGHMITCKTEHKAVLDTSEYLQEKGHDVTFLEVDEHGVIDLEKLESSIRENTVLISIMLANNETGVIQPIKKISEIAAKKGIPVFTDATQAIGKIHVDVMDLGVDLMSFSSHKMYGPKGMGALFVSSRAKLNIHPQLHGGGHERGFRSGTLNVPSIVGFGKACDLAGKKIIDESQRQEKLRNHLEAELLKMDAININCFGVDRLPNVSNITFEDIDGNRLMRSLNKLVVSQGSACNSNHIEPSHVLQAMGLSRERALSSIRISLGIPTTDEEIKTALGAIKTAVENLRLQLQ